MAKPMTLRDLYTYIESWIDSDQHDLKRARQDQDADEADERYFEGRIDRLIDVLETIREFGPETPRHGTHCSNCGKWMKPDDIWWSRQGKPGVYCSSECQMSAMHELPKLCSMCAKDLSAQNGAHFTSDKYPDRKYCSLGCYDRAHT